jgi:hypothetical protein
MANSARIVVDWQTKETVELPLIGYHSGDNPTKLRGWVTVRCTDRETGKRLPSNYTHNPPVYRIREINVENIEDIWKLGEFGER